LAQTVVINATSIGARPDGISAYGVHLLKALAAVPSGLDFEVLLNRDARARLGSWTPPAWMRLRWTSRWVSPDRGSGGHLARWALANAVAWRHRRHVLFSLSQIEAATWPGPSVVTVHDVIPLLFPEHHPRQYHYYHHFLGPALRRTAAIVTPSAATRDQLAHCYGLPADNIHVIHHGPTVPARGAPQGRAAGRPFILCLARPSPTKNVTTLLDAFALIQNHVREDLVIAGAGVDQDPILRRWANGMGGSGRVAFRSDVSEGEKIRLLDGATALVCTSLDEGFGLPPLEAMRRGCPVVVSRVGSLPEVCGTAAAFVDPRDVGDIASTIRRLLGDEPWRRALIRRGLERARAFSWRLSAHRHIHVLKEVCDVG
jgi:glycosyltransferase involved in cell wall biosynthesis